MRTPLPLKWYAARHTQTIDLTDVGASIMVAHVDATKGEVSAATNSDSADVGIPGKLSARQIAQYHHEVFELLELPPQTFGGTPITGALREADLTKFLWCRSCDE